MDRFIDKGQRLSAFADEVFVNCIGCGEPGVVRGTRNTHRWTAGFECSACRLALRSDAGHWVGAVRLSGRRPCGHCGHKWLQPAVLYESPPEEWPTQLPAECSECGHQTLVNGTLSRVLPDDRCGDPHFGLPLRLTQQTRHGTVWAYNPRHLNELAGYVAAKLRVRQGASNAAMFSRLPKWMKLAKHRDEIARAIHKMQSLA